MVIDTSAVIAIANDEPERDALLDVISSAPRRLFSTASWLELTIASQQHDNAMVRTLAEALVGSLELELVPVTVEHGSAARLAWRTYGRGRHRAKLNFGDCFAYATAVVAGEPLLFKGDDFVHTDVAVALY